MQSHANGRSLRAGRRRPPAVLSGRLSDAGRGDPGAQVRGGARDGAAHHGSREVATPAPGCPTVPPARAGHDDPHRRAPGSASGRGFRRARRRPHVTGSTRCRWSRPICRPTRSPSTCLMLPSSGKMPRVFAPLQCADRPFRVLRNPAAREYDVPARLSVVPALHPRPNCRIFHVTQLLRGLARCRRR